MHYGLPDTNASLTLHFLKEHLLRVIDNLQEVADIYIDSNVYSKTVSVNNCQSALLYQFKGNEWINVEFLACRPKFDFIKGIVSSLNCEVVFLTVCDTEDSIRYTHYTSAGIISHFSYPSDDLEDEYEGDWSTADIFLKDQQISAFYACWSRQARHNNVATIVDECLNIDDFVGIFRIIFRS